jgi:hypothetical protein
LYEWKECRQVCRLTGNSLAIHYGFKARASNESTSGVKKLLTTVPVRKPSPQEFVRVRGDKDYRDAFALIELKDDRETYRVPPSIAREIPGEFFMATIRTAINRRAISPLTHS